MNTAPTTPEDIEKLALAALLAHGADEGNAAPVARALARAEAEGNRVCGLFYLPIFCDHLLCGKVDGRAVPELSLRAATISVDARSGFAHPAIEKGLPALVAAAREHGIAAMAVRHSYNCLALSHHVTPIAEHGLIGICVANAPASVAPPGATKPLFGTNPLAFAIPAADGPSIVVDQSMSAVTKTAVILRKNSGEPIPHGWAQDSDGHPTTDAATGLDGSLLPAGGQKGANVALLVEILAAALTGSHLSIQASGLSDNRGGPPGLGQFLLAVDPGNFAADRFAESLTSLAAAYEQAGVRLPGRACKWQDHVEVDADLWRRVNALVAARSG